MVFIACTLLSTTNVPISQQVQFVQLICLP